MYDHNSNRIITVILLILSVVSMVTAQKSQTLYPSNSNIMELARRRYIDDLPFPKNYQPGKYCSWGVPDPGKKATVVELDGPGVITRIWNTHWSDQDILKLYIYVDDQKEPVLSGPARAVAAAAQKLSCPAVPWGGFLDGRSVSLYLPIPFKRHIRIDAEYKEKLLDGPYWQIDYKLGLDPGPFDWKQVDTSDGIQIIPTNTTMPKAESNVYETLTQEMKVSFEPVNILLTGPAVIRRIHIKSNYLDNLQLRIAFDDDRGYGDPERLTDHVNFQVDVPLKYFISKFNTAGIQHLGNIGTIFFPMPFKSEALLQLQHIMEENEFGAQSPVTITIEYEKELPEIDKMYYFHASAATEVTNGYQDFEVLNIRGKGHFVGVNLFDTSHDHGGGDNIFFDAGTSTAGQLHGICAEDYFHHAYMRIGVSAPYIHCPMHSARCRHHIEMPIPFQESFTFNWGSFAGVSPKAVAMWYQKDLEQPLQNDMTYTITGPFRIDRFDELAPNKPLPENASVMPFGFKKSFDDPRKTWKVRAQNGFVDLCHAFRQYTCTIPPATGFIDTDCCVYAQTRVWVAEDVETEFQIGCDERIRVFLGNEVLAEDNGRNQPDPYQQFSATATLKAGLNTITVVMVNTANTNWHWNGFSLVVKNKLEEDQMFYAY